MRDARFRELVERYAADPEWLPSVANDITNAIHAELSALDAGERTTSWRRDLPVAPLDR